MFGTRISFTAPAPAGKMENCIFCIYSQQLLNVVHAETIPWRRDSDRVRVNGELFHARTRVEKKKIMEHNLPFFIVTILFVRLKIKQGDKMWVMEIGDEHQ